MIVEDDLSSASTLSSSYTSLDSLSFKTVQVPIHSVSYKSCRRHCHHICPRALAKYKALLNNRKRHARTNNFILDGIKCIQDLYQWTHEFIHKRLLPDEFLRSVIASIALFTVGMKLTYEFVI